MAATVPAPAFGQNIDCRGITVVYGGSFDPPHMGHQMACLYLLEALAAQEVWLMPTYQHNMGKDLASFEQRFAMCQAMARPLGGRLQVQRLEAEMGGPSRSFDTVSELARRHPQRRFALAVGADLVAQMPQWHRFGELKATWPVVVVGRQGHPFSHSPLQLPAVASFEVRRRLLVGEAVTGWMPRSVAHYIDEHRVYPTAGAARAQSLAAGGPLGDPKGRRS